MRCNNCFEEYDEDLGVCPYCGYTEGQPPKELYMLFAGTVLQSRYIVGKVLGFGGFGITYKAYDTKLERMVAIKEYYPAGLVYRTPGTKDVVVFKGKRYKDYADGLKRFLDEARNATKFLDNPYIVDVMEFFEENSTAYFVMELFVGVTLDEFLKENGGRIDGESAVAIALSVGGALKDIHKAGYIHRDVAPDNIYMLSNGKIKLFDFGAARFSANETLSIVLKPGYAPAEQYDSVNKQGPWTDIYALGATMYRMVVGVKPDESTNRKMEDKEQPPHELIPEISENLSNAIMRAMSVEIHLRYQTIDEFMAAITSEKKVRSVESVRKRRKNFRWIGIASSVLIVAGLVTYFSRNWNKQKGEATLPDAKINVWYVMDDADNMEESHKAKGITQALNDFTEMYSNVEINYEAIPKEEYSERLKAAAEENNLPDLFESTGIEETVLSNAETLGNVISEVDTDKLYFLNNYEEYYKSEKQIPTSFVMPVVFINTTKAEFDGDFLKDINEIVSDDKEITYSIDDDWIEYYNDKVDFGKYREIEDGKEAFVSGQSAIYFGSSKDIEGIYETMTGKCKHITLEGDEVQCRAGCDWSISGISGKDEIKVAERLLAYLIEDPTAQDYLYMQGDLGDKTKLPVNKGAIETLIGDDAQFYKNILSEIDNFGYKGE